MPIGGYIIWLHALLGVGLAYFGFMSVATGSCRRGCGAGESGRGESSAGCGDGRTGARQAGVRAGARLVLRGCTGTGRQKRRPEEIGRARSLTGRLEAEGEVLRRAHARAERHVNLFLQDRRLGYSPARGYVLLMAEVERLSNHHASSCE